MVGQPGFFDLSDRLRELSAKGDDLERIAALVEFEQFRPDLERAVPRGDGSKGGRPAFDHVLMFNILLLQALFARFDATLKAAGYLAMGGQIVDATIVAAPKQRNTEAEKAALRDGRIPEDWAKKPAKLRQKDRGARWTVKFSKARPREDGAPQVDLAVPAFGYKNHVSIDRAHGLIRGWQATHAAAHDGARLEAVLDAGNTASEVWADTAYRSAKNEAMRAARGLVSRIHRKKPQGRPMPERTRRANARKSAVRSRVEHVFAHQKGIMGLMVRTIGIARAEVKIGLANLASNIRRLLWLSGKAAPA